MQPSKSDLLLARLLSIALFFVFLQVLIGGTTRLTGSGLSMTNWHIVTGTFPPMTDAAWETEFQHYKDSPQYKEINKGMNLAAFKKIFFWEWLHRVWGRWGFVFLLGIFGWYLWRYRPEAKIVKRFIPLLILYVCQGLLGWFMVKSGLVDIPRVSHYRLAAHLLLAIFLFAYILWFIVRLRVPDEQRIHRPEWQRFSLIMIILTLVQITFGAFMSGLRAATAYPSWPDMNGALVPENLFALSPFWANFAENITTIQFVHRGLAYLLCALVVYFFFRARKDQQLHQSFRKGLNGLPAIIGIQILLGITVLMLAKSGEISVFFGVAHQGMGLLLLSCMLYLHFQYKKA